MVGHVRIALSPKLSKANNQGAAGSSARRIAMQLAASAKKPIHDVSTRNKEGAAARKRAMSATGAPMAFATGL